MTKNEKIALGVVVLAIGGFCYFGIYKPFHPTGSAKKVGGNDTNSGSPVGFNPPPLDQFMNNANTTGSNVASGVYFPNGSSVSTDFLNAIQNPIFPTFGASMRGQKQILAAWMSNGKYYKPSQGIISDSGGIPAQTEITKQEYDNMKYNQAI